MPRIRCKDQELYPVGVNRRLCFGRVDLPVPGGPDGIVVPNDRFDEGEWKAIKSDDQLIVEQVGAAEGSGAPIPAEPEPEPDNDKNHNGIPDDEERKRRRKK